MRRGGTGRRACSGWQLPEPKLHRRRGYTRSSASLTLAGSCVELPSSFCWRETASAPCLACAPNPASPGFAEHALAADLLVGSMRRERQGTGAHNLRTLSRSCKPGYRATHEPQPNTGSIRGPALLPKTYKKPENTLSGKPEEDSPGGIVFPNPCGAVAFFCPGGTMTHRGARTSHMAIAPPRAALHTCPALPMLPSAPPVAELG